MTDSDLTWFAAVARPGRVFDAVGEFVGAGLTAFAPREMRRRKMSPKGKAFEAYAVPACGSYLFIGTDGRQPRIEGHKHVLDLLRVADVAARIDHRSIARMRELDGVWSTDVRYGGVSPRALRVGDEVAVGENEWVKMRVSTSNKFNHDGAIEGPMVTLDYYMFGAPRQTTVKRAVIDAAMEAA